MERSLTAKRVSTARRVGWLTVASMLALALLAPATSSAASFNGAIWTSLSDGTAVNANIYADKSDVYLNGGPQNCGGGQGLPDGDYYFQVTDPSGSVLLSQDAIKFRQVAVINGVITGVSGDGNHIEGAGGCNGGLPVQLMPYATTPNNGGEYSVDMGPVADVEACDGFDADSATFNILDCSAPTKNDNYKVRFADPAISLDKVADPTEVPADGADVTYTYTVSNVGDTALSDVTVEDDTCSPVDYVSGDDNTNDLLDLDEIWIFTCTMLITEDTTNVAIAHGWDGENEVTDDATADVTVLPPTAPPTDEPTAPPTLAPTPTVAPTPTFVQSVGAETGTPSVTLPPTDVINGPSGPADGTWRLALIALAALLASVLVLTPARATSRRR
ncbi:MAG TPA: hypothetical protein VIH00_05780 [Candidatus Limnocylindrales bacterium]|nr:MAG: hypothetical protein A2V84_07475 [Chloroflexi bacterium RBG_16_70_13]